MKQGRRDGREGDQQGPLPRHDEVLPRLCGLTESQDGILHCDPCERHTIAHDRRHARALPDWAAGGRNFMVTDGRGGFQARNRPSHARAWLDQERSRVDVVNDAHDRGLGVASQFGCGCGVAGGVV